MRLYYYITVGYCTHLRYKMWNKSRCSSNFSHNFSFEPEKPLPIAGSIFFAPLNSVEFKMANTVHMTDVYNLTRISILFLKLELFYIFISINVWDTILIYYQPNAYEMQNHTIDKNYLRNININSYPSGTNKIYL